MIFLKPAFALVAALTFSTHAMAQEYTFKLHQFLGAEGAVQKKMLEPWARRVEANSEGRVKIEIYPSMSLGGRPPELVQQARDGIVDMIWTVNGYTPGVFPRSEVFELPNVHTNNPTATNLAMADMFETDLKQEYQGLEVMFLHTHAGQAIQMRDKRIDAVEDLKGVKLRIPARTGAWSIEALGASPAAMPVPELPQALSKGTVDGALIPFEIIPALKIEQQTGFQIEGQDQYRVGTIVFQLSMNKSRWDALPADIQKAFRDASDKKWLRELGALWRENDDIGLKVATDAGNEHIILSQDETNKLKETLEPVVKRWVDEVSSKGIDGAAMVEKARAAIAKNGS